MITQFDKPILKVLAQEVLEAVQPIAAKHGLVVKPGGGVFDPLTYTLKVKFEIGGQAGKDAMRAEFERYAPMFGLAPTDYGKKFTFRREQFEVVGLEPTRPKFCIKGQRVRDGKIYFFPVTALGRTSRFEL